MRILLLDIETAPKQAFVWKVWKENIPPVMLISDWFMLTWAAKWLESNSIMSKCVSPYGAIHEDDHMLLPVLWELLNKADVVIAHNGKRFDVPGVNTRFIYHGMTPPSPYRQIDTLLEARKIFKFTFNNLDYLGEFLKVGKKRDTDGFPLWKRCRKGDVKALQEMLLYNKQDVTLLEKVYKKLRPYMRNPPSHGVYQVDGRPVCSHCGSPAVQSRGTYSTQVSTFRRWWCKQCGGWSRSRQNIRSQEHMKNTLLPAI